MTDVRVPSHEIHFSEGQIHWITSRIQEVLRTGHVVLGGYTMEFEEKYAERCGRKYGVAMSSDTAAFEALLKIIDVEGETVLYPALGFPSLMESVKNAGGNAEFVDASIEHGLFATAEMIEAAIRRVFHDLSARVPKALILMHTGGLLASESAKIEEVCNRHGVVVFEDAAHAYGAVHKGRVAGSFGVASAFSLYATKPMHSMEGGMVVTDDEEIADRAKTMRNYGRVSTFGRSICTEHGYSWRMTEMQAIVGLSNLKTIDDNIACRREIMAEYDAIIGEDGEAFDGLAVPLLEPDGMMANGYRYICMLPEGWGPEDRSRMKATLLEDAGIDLPGEVYELPTHKQPIWIDQYADVSMPVAEDFCNRHFALPCYPTLPGKISLDEIVAEVGLALKKTEKERG